MKPSLLNHIFYLLFKEDVDRITNLSRETKQAEEELRVQQQQLEEREKLLGERHRTQEELSRISGWIKQIEDCQTKIVYQTCKEAEYHSMYLATQQIFVAPYLCSVCGLYHNTHVAQNTVKFQKEITRKEYNSRFKYSLADKFIEAQAKSKRNGG